MWSREKVAQAEIILRPYQITGKGRPRHTKSGRTYTPDATTAAEREIASVWRQYHGGKFREFMGEVEIQVAYSKHLAKSSPKKWEGRADLGRPDVDNVLKLVMDALNGVAYHDDSQVTTAHIRKLPRTKADRPNVIRVQLTYYDEKFTKE